MYIAEGSDRQPSLIIRVKCIFRAACIADRCQMQLWRPRNTRIWDTRTRHNRSVHNILPLVCTKPSCSVLPFLNPGCSLHNSMVGQRHFNRRTTTYLNSLHPQNELDVSIYVVRLVNFCSSDSEVVFSIPSVELQTILNSYNLYRYVFVFYHCIYSKHTLC